MSDGVDGMCTLVYVREREWQLMLATYIGLLYLAETASQVTLWCSRSWLDVLHASATGPIATSETGST